MKNRLTRARQLYRSIIVEIRDLSNPEQIQEWEAKARGFDDKISKLLQDVEWAEKSTAVDNDGRKKVAVNEMTTSEITKMGLQIQEKTQESTTRTKKLLQETIEIGTAANAELKNQGEKLIKIEEDVEQVESNLKRADRQLRIFIRRMASDRIFMVLIVLLGAGILAIVVLTVLQKRCIGTQSNFLFFLIIVFGGSTWVKNNCPSSTPASTETDAQA